MNKSGTLHFWIEGESFTDLVRDMWDSSQPKNAIQSLTEGMGMNNKQALSIILGKNKLIGDTKTNNGQLFMEKENRKNVKPYFFTLKKMTDRLENDYLHILQRENVLNRMLLQNCGVTGKVPGLVSAKASYYRKKLSKYDRVKSEKMAETREQIGKQLEFIYSVQNKNMSSFPHMDKIGLLPTENESEYAEEVFESSQRMSESNKMLNEERRKEKLREMEVEDEEALKKIKKEEEDQIKINQIQLKEYTTPASFKDMPKDQILHHWWLSSDGLFYIVDEQGHDDLAYALQDIGKFTTDISYPKDYITEQGWIPCSSGSMRIDYTKVTQQQIDKLFDYMTYFKKTTLKIHDYDTPFKELLECIKD